MISILIIIYIHHICISLYPYIYGYVYRDLCLSIDIKIEKDLDGDREIYGYTCILRGLFQGIGFCHGGAGKLKFIGRPSGRAGGDSQVKTLRWELTLLSTGRAASSSGKAQFCSQRLSTDWTRPTQITRIISLIESHLTVDVNHMYKMPSQQQLYSFWLESLGTPA